MKEINRVTRLTVKVAEETFLPPAEREERHRRRNADVYPDISNLGFVAEFSRGSPATGEKARHIPVFSAVYQFDRIINGVRMDEAKHGAKNFGSCNVARRVKVLQNRRTHEISILKT